MRINRTFISRTRLTNEIKKIALDCYYVYAVCVCILSYRRKNFCQLDNGRFYGCNTETNEMLLIKIKIEQYNSKKKMYGKNHKSNTKQHRHLIISTQLIITAAERASEQEKRNKSNNRKKRLIEFLRFLLKNYNVHQTIRLQHTVH